MLYVEARRWIVLSAGLFIWYFTTHLNGGIFGYSITHDLLARHNTNDSYISSYYLTWTVVYYIPTLFSVILVKLVYFNTTFEYKSVLIYLSVLTCSIAFYLYELLDFFAINYTRYVIIDTDPVFNQLLVNFLNRYHPYLFYICACYVFYYCSLNRVYESLPNYNIKVVFKIKNFNLFLLSFLFLYLGAWWANQEGSWGGWWNSDSSEMLGLLLGLSSLLVIHIPLSQYYYFRFNRVLLKLFINFVLLYYFLQINYELSSHNFGLQSFIFFNNNVSFTFVMFILLLWIISIEHQIYHKTLVSKYTGINTLSYSSKFFNNLLNITIVFILIWLTMSLVPIISTFKTQTQFTLDHIFFILYNLFLVYIFLLVACTFFKLTPVPMVVSLGLVFSQLPVLAYLTLIRNIMHSELKTIHWVVIAFTGLNILTGGCLFFFIQNIPYYTERTCGDALYSANQLVYINEGCLVNHVLLETNLEFQFLKGWTLVSESNAVDVDSFVLQLNSTVMTNSIHLATGYFKNILIIEFNEVYLLNIIVLTLIWIVWLIVKTKLPCVY